MNRSTFLKLLPAAFTARWACKQVAPIPDDSTIHLVGVQPLRIYGNVITNERVYYTHRTTGGLGHMVSRELLEDTGYKIHGF